MKVVGFARAKGKNRLISKSTAPRNFRKAQNFTETQQKALPKSRVSLAQRILSQRHHIILLLTKQLLSPFNSCIFRLLMFNSLFFLM